MIQTYNTGQIVHVYELLEEIHATNYTTYVDTGVYTSSNISVEAKWKCNPDHIPQHGENDRIIASTTSWNDRNTMAFDFEETPHLKWKFIGDTSWSYNNSITPDSNEHICKLSATEFVYDGNVLATHSQTSIGTTSTQLRIAQSDAYQPAGEQGYYYYYYVKIWDGATLIRNYVPAKRMSDNVYGFYDTVNSTFNPSIGNKGFTGTSKSTPEYIDAIAGATKYVNDIILYKSGITTHKYEVLDYVTCNQYQYFDTDIYAQSGISVEMTCKMTSRPGNTRFFSTHDPRDTSGQNWAFASGTWGLQFEGNTMCIKMLGNNNNISSFAMTSVKFSRVSGHKYLYDLSCDGIFNIYEPSDNSLWYTFDCTAGTDPTKVSQTTIRMFGREAGEQSEWFYGVVHDVKIKNNGTTIRHYIPVKRLSDNAIGFYETETEMFLTSASGTNFSGTSKAVPEYIDATTSQTIHINKIYLNGEVYWGNESTSAPLYEILNEIHPVQNSGTVYFNTDYLYKSDTTIETQYECMSDVLTTVMYPRLYQSNTTPYYGAEVVAVSHQPHIHIKRNGYTNWDNYYNYGWTSGLRTLRQSQNEVSINGTVLWSGTSSYVNTTYPIILMNDGGHDQGATGMFYIHYYKFYESSTLVHEYLPVKRLYDNVYGFYDRVTDTFLTNLGTGSVTGTPKSTPEYIY